MLQSMLAIRNSEEQIMELFLANLVRGSTHLAIGQEACAVGVAAVLKEGDTVTCTYRGHHHALALGMSIKAMMAEMMGKASGCCQGKGGSMHISNMELGMLGANGIVGGGPPIAMGAAFSNKFRKTDNVACCFFGDGASNEGSFHEAANMAALYKLPVVFVCENNGYGEYTPQANHQAIVDVADRAPGYGMPGVIVDGMDVVAVYEAAGEAIARARAGGGPTLLECKTYRYYDHVGVRGMGLSYRTDEEVEEWKKKDPIAQFESRLAEQDVLSAEDARKVHDEALAEIADAIKFAEDSPYPEADALLEDVYA